MKKIFVLVCFSSLFLESCATVLGGKITTCQAPTAKPRQVRPVWLIADIVCGFVPLVVDFVTTAVYKPCK